jgi:hypothetical protein
VVWGGYLGLGLARSSIAGATIVESPSPRGSTAYEVMEELRDQVVSPVTVEGGPFALPSGRAGGNAPLGEHTSSLQLLLDALDMAGGGRSPAAASMLTRGRSAFLAIDRTIKQFRGGRTVNVGAAQPSLQDDRQEWTVGWISRTQGQRSQSNPPEGLGAGGPGNLRLFRFDPQAHICGGLISRRGKGANRFCISTHCSFKHNKKIFDRLGKGDYYIIEPGGRGAGSSQLRALLEPSFPRAAAEYSLDNQEVLESVNLMEGWLSLFRFLIDAETQGAARTNPGLKGFATRSHKAAFTMPLRDNTRHS